MNPGLDHLHPYPFEKLAALKAGIEPPADKQPIDLSIGEPKHATPAFILDTLRDNLPLAARYPVTRGAVELRASIARWLCRRFSLASNSLDPDRHILPVNGSREALFAFAQCIVNPGDQSTVILPNPFYQIYEGAALLAGARPVYMSCTRDNHFQPDLAQIPESDWRQCALVYLCSPGNPTGAVIDEARIRALFELSDKYGFVIAADECYSEIYFDEVRPPKGLLQYASEFGRDNYENCMVFHSLSKRSNVPGMRSGFVAGDPKLIAAFLRYRTYHGCAMAGYTQQASISAWNDEEHVKHNRALYRDKFNSALEILGAVLDVQMPDAAFYLWPTLPVDDETFTRDLYQQQGVTVLPGRYLSRTINGLNPGENHVRIALVASHHECELALRRIADQLTHY